MGNAIHAEEDITTQMADLLLLNLTFEQSEVLKDVFVINWTHETGIMDNVDDVITEYRNARKLLPVRLAILEPPQCGKTALARQLAMEYQLHVISAENLIKNTVEQLQEIVSRHEAKEVEDEDRGDDDDEGEDDYDDDDGTFQEAQDLYTDIQDGREMDHRLDDELFCRIFKYQLTSKRCKNQGYVLDGFPKTREQAQLLFQVGDDEQEEFEDGELPTVSYLPERVIGLEASDDWLKQRVMNLSEETVQGTHNDEEGFLRRLKTYREANTEDDSPLTYYDEQEVHPQSYVLDGNLDPAEINRVNEMKKREASEQAAADLIAQQEEERL